MDKLSAHSLDFSIALKKLALLYKQSRASAILNVIIACILVSVLWDSISHTHLVMWISIMALVAIVRVCMSIAFFKNKIDQNNIASWQNGYFVTLLLIASAWGLGSLLMLFQLEPVYQVTVFFFLMGMGGGFLIAHSVNRMHLFTFMPILFIPSISFAMIEGAWAIKVVGGTALIFMLAGINAARIMTNVIHQNFLLTKELNDARLEAEKLANVDALTNMNNRRAFLALARQQINLCERMEKPITLLMADVDNFKSINDNYGHDSGDKALKLIASTITSNQREADISARLGGEEFVVLLADTTTKDAYQYAERLRLNIEDSSLSLHATTLSLSVSVGIASNLYDIEQLLERADRAMYQAKSQGRNQVVILSE